MSPSIFPCYAPEDSAAAAELARFLEAGAEVRVFLEEGRLQPGEDLALKARDARMADIVLVLFSRDSLPRPWPRSEWEDALVTEPAEEGVRIGFVKCDDCAPPQVLRPRFDLSAAPRHGLRSLKRWIRGRDTAYTHEPALEELAAAIADLSGTATAATAEIAAEFARHFRDDFDAVCALECSGRSLTALTGDLAAQLGLRLEGDLESNLDRLREFCSARRLLLLFSGESEEAEALMFGGRCSALLSPTAPSPAPAGELQQIQRALAGINAADDWAEICALARQGRRITQDQGRIAECDELMQQWHAAAAARGDRAVLDESAREMVWILETWGRIEEARLLDYRRATEFGAQLLLPF